MWQPMGQTMMGNTMMNQNMGQPVNVQPAQFSAFAGGNLGNYQPENIDLIMDVPLQVTVELGRTTKSISDILDLGPGKIIELNKLAGEPIDVLVNALYNFWVHCLFLLLFWLLHILPPDGWEVCSVDARIIRICM